MSSEEHNEIGTPSRPNRAGLSVVCVDGVRTGDQGLSQNLLQSTGCAPQTEYTDEHAGRHMSGADLSSGVSEFSYSGDEPNLLPAGHEVYLPTSSMRTVEKRRDSRIPSRNVQACIRTEQGSSLIVDLINISRRGVCFTSPVNFLPGTLISIATHYFKGGQNIFQDGKIVRVQHRPTPTSPGEYALKF